MEVLHLDNGDIEEDKREKLNKGIKVDKGNGLRRY